MSNGLIVHVSTGGYEYIAKLDDPSCLKKPPRVIKLTDAAKIQYVQNPQNPSQIGLQMQSTKHNKQFTGVLYIYPNGPVLIQLLDPDGEMYRAYVQIHSNLVYPQGSRIAKPTDMRAVPPLGQRN